MSNRTPESNESQEPDNGLGVIGGLAILGLAIYGLSKLLDDSPSKLERQEQDILSRFAEEEFRI